MKIKLPEYDTTPMTETIKEKIQGIEERRVVYDWLILKLTYAEISAKNKISIAKVGRILRNARLRVGLFYFTLLSKEASKCISTITQTL